MRATLSDAHRRYNRMINFREGWRGHLFQSRFASYSMYNAQLMMAVRYVENNALLKPVEGPVAASMVQRAEDYRCSSASSNTAGEQVEADPLTDLAALNAAMPNWCALLRYRLDESEIGEDGEAIAETIETRLRTGRSLAAEDWIARQEERLGRRLRPRKRGPKPQAA